MIIDEVRRGGNDLVLAIKYAVDQDPSPKDSAFTGCNFFDAEFTGCKLVGSSFVQCTLRPLRVRGGDWSFAGLAGGDLRGSDLTAFDLFSVELAGAIIRPDQAIVMAESFGLTVSTVD